MAEVSMTPKAKIKVQVAKFRGDISLDELPEDYTQHPDFLGIEEVEIDPEDLSHE